MLRLRNKGTSFLGSMAAPKLKRKALNSWAAVQDTFFSTKDTFERHRVVFTVGTSIASVATAWIGYSLRHYHDSKVDQRLESIEKAGRISFIVVSKPEVCLRLIINVIGYVISWSVLWDLTLDGSSVNSFVMKNSHHLEHDDLKLLVDPGPSKTAAWVATAGTALVVGYGLGWRGGAWYANRKFRKEQLKLLGQVKPKRWQLLGQIKSRGWQLRFLRPSAARSRGLESGSKTSEMTPNNAPTSCKSTEARQSS